MLRTPRNDAAPRAPAATADRARAGGPACAPWRNAKGGSRPTLYHAGPNPLGPCTRRQESGETQTARVQQLDCAATRGGGAILVSTVRHVHVALLGCVLGACAATPKRLPNVEGNREELPKPEVFFPLQDGHIYQYTVVGQDGRTGFLISKVSRQDDVATLTSGDRSHHLTIRNEGVFNDAGYFIVKLPMTLGAEWAGQSGIVRVIEVGKTVQTGAGKFVDCVVTQEVTQGTVEVRTAESTFCPNVGLAKLVVRAGAQGEPATGKDGGQNSPGPTPGQSVAVEEATLQYFGPPIDVNAL